METNTVDFVPIQDGESPILKATDEITQHEIDEIKQRVEEIREERIQREEEAREIQRQVKQEKRDRKKLIRNIIITVVVSLVLIAAIVTMIIKMKDIERGIRRLHRRVQRQILIAKLRRRRRPGQCKKCNKHGCNKCDPSHVKFGHSKYRDNMKGFWYNKGMHDFMNGRYHGRPYRGNTQYGDIQQPKQKRITDSMNHETEVKTDELVLHGTIDDKEVTVVNPLRKILSQTTEVSVAKIKVYILRTISEFSSDSLIQFSTSHFSLSLTLPSQ